MAMPVLDDKGTFLVDLTVTLDLICPWCYILIKEIDNAIDRAKKNDLPLRYRIEFKPFILDPTLPLDHSVEKASIAPGLVTVRHCSSRLCFF
jgi:hypothetical protein